MQVSLTAMGGLERRLEVAVPVERVASEVEQRLKKISRTARLKGFRPGKAPYEVIRKQYSEQVHAEVVGDLMRSSFAEAVSQEKLTPAAGPRIEPISIDAGSDLRYAAVFEVLPEIRVKPPEGVKIERPVATVTEADVDAMIESMRRQRPVFTAIERAAADTDRVTVDYAGQIGGVALAAASSSDANFVVGAGRVIPELDQAVKGMVVGETRTVPVHFPAEHPNAQLAGKVAEFSVTVKKVEAQSLPEIDEEFITAFGVKDGGMNALRTEVRASMERELAQAVTHRLRAAVMDALYRENTLEVPRALVEEQVERLQHDMARRMGARDASQLPPKEPFEEPARRRVALGLLLSEIIRAQELKADRGRVQSRLTELAASHADPQEARHAYLHNADAMRQIESAVLEDQVVDWILERAAITERPASFAELTGFGQPNETHS